MNRILYFLPTIILFLSCQSMEQQEQPDVTSELEQVFNDFYKTYEKGDTTFLRYYADSVRWMHTDGRVEQGRDKFREGWQQTMEKYRLEVLNYTEPTIIAGTDQATTYNDYQERFISRETGDTVNNNGTWIGIWQRQKNDSWKVVFHTWHLSEK